MSERLASRYTEPHPRCFMHMPKCGGVSVHDALVAALPAASVSPKRYDHLLLGFRGADELSPEARETLLLEEHELDAMARSEFVSGHFPLPTLMRVAPPESIATVLREPRARILSLYAFWRLTAIWDEVVRNPVYNDALRPLDEFLVNPVRAGATDNVMCRMLLGSDPRMSGGFIPTEHIEGVTSDAIDWLDQLGFVGVLERGQTTWEGLSSFFGGTLEPKRLNVTASSDVRPDALPIQELISDRTLDLLHARTAADAIVYRHALMAEVTEVEAQRISDAAFAAQLVRIGDVGGKSAASVQSLNRRVAEAESQIAGLGEQLSTREEELDAQREMVSRLEEELTRHRMWLEGIQGSFSWRITSPLRAAKRRVLPAKPR